MAAPRRLVREGSSRDAKGTPGNVPTSATGEAPGTGTTKENAHAMRSFGYYFQQSLMHFALGTYVARAILLRPMSPGLWRWLLNVSGGLWVKGAGRSRNPVNRLQDPCQYMAQGDFVKCMRIGTHEGRHEMPAAVIPPEEATPVSAKQWKGFIARTVESSAFTASANIETKELRGIFIVHKDCIFNVNRCVGKVRWG